MRIAAIMLVAGLLLQGCGHKGPLFLPVPQAIPQHVPEPATQPPAQQAPQPIPAK